MDYSKKHEISVYLTEEQLNQRIAEIGAQITERFKGESVYLVCILKGSIFFTTAASAGLMYFRNPQYLPQRSRSLLQSTVQDPS